ncbi:MAG: 1-acyl-sn-glycerol-3-phosphate acyltransferase [Clostridia bacterium]|nr:1-acyl-sn-glycerol-3-phosphate acyltransferase [Clostridia bacterium]
MLIKLFNAFTKITGIIPQFFCFRTKVHYENKAVQGRYIKGGAIIISNHTAVFDYAVYLFVFFFRTLRTVMAEVLFQKQPLGTFLKMMGGIRVDREANEYGYMVKCEKILRDGGVLCVFPEGRLPKPGEERPLPFKPGAAYLALSTGVPVIPVYTNGSYFKKKRAEVMIGTPIYPRDHIQSDKSDKENTEILSAVMRERLLILEKSFEERTKQK